MNTASAQHDGTTAAAASAQPAMFEPDDEHAQLARKAVEERRLHDAERHLRAVSEDSLETQAWTLWVRGRIAVEREHSAEAEPYFLQAAVLALIAANDGGVPRRSALLRLAASSLEHAGRVQRRRDRLTNAERMHEQALRLREAHGTVEEQWETRISLGLDAAVAKRLQDARGHFSRAADLGRMCSVDPDRCSAVARAHLATVLAGIKLHAEAVIEAREALAAERKHDPGSEQVARAEMLLGRLLLAHAEAISDENPPGCEAALTEAEELLQAAGTELPAFSPVNTRDAEACAELLAIAARLRTSMARS
ncbi:MAG: hypothetical protein J5J06_16795 [Phycisphaerae bacterium]|nr:hypothetical protein [Phycisphaerae bacterium]